MKKLFGTDGIRAVAGEYPLDFASVHTLGKALISLLRDKGLEPRVIIGRDTRESGVWIERALAQGVGEAGGEVLSAGVIPTSAVSFLTLKHRYSAGLVISASHNPYRDNGIKIFSSEGLKLSDEWEAELERDILSPRKEPVRKQVNIRPIDKLGAEYKTFLQQQVEPLPGSRPIQVVLDCSNGAASHIAPAVFTSLGCKTKVIHNTPNGKNINKGCGSLHPRDLSSAVLDAGADIGIAYDGDADRAVWVDETGHILNGDHTLFVQARHMKGRSRLRSDAVVATTMSNMGLEAALGKEGLRLERTRVGDKYVLERMIAIGSNLGGERSGHTIFIDHCPTGDGILTSLKMVEALAASGFRLSELVSALVEFPQVLTSVRVSRKEDFDRIPEITRIMEEIKHSLSGEGRLDVRYSGTEPVARVMVEGRDQKQIEECARRLADVINRHLG